MRNKFLKTRNLLHHNFIFIYFFFFKKDSEIDKGASSTINKRGYALLLDWRPVPLTLTTTTIINESYSAKDGSSLTSKIISEIRKSGENSSRQRGYKVRFYVVWG